MLKKIVITIIAIILILNTINVNSKEIPNEAIRIRIVANSNSTYDQEIKEKLKNKVQLQLSKLLSDSKSIIESRQIIMNNYNKLDKLVNNTLEEENYDLGYQMNYGYNYFPEKEFNGKLYEEGEYESLLITLGKGQGDNWWCVLFPPLCIIEADENETKDVEYDSFFIKLIRDIF